MWIPQRLMQRDGRKRVKRLGKELPPSSPTTLSWIESLGVAMTSHILKPYGVGSPPDRISFSASQTYSMVAGNTVSSKKGPLNASVFEGMPLWNIIGLATEYGNYATIALVSKKWRKMLADIRPAVLMKIERVMVSPLPIPESSLEYLFSAFNAFKDPCMQRADTEDLHILQPHIFLLLEGYVHSVLSTNRKLAEKLFVRTCSWLSRETIKSIYRVHTCLKKKNESDTDFSDVYRLFDRLEAVKQNVLDVTDCLGRVFEPYITKDSNPFRSDYCDFLGGFVYKYPQENDRITWIRALYLANKSQSTRAAAALLRSAGGADGMLKTMTLVTQDGDEFVIPFNSNVFSCTEMLKDMLLPRLRPKDRLRFRDVRTRVFSRFIEFAMMNEATPLAKVDPAKITANLHDCVPERFADFMDLPQVELFELIVFANQFNNQPFVDLTCAKTRSIIIGKSKEEIQEQFIDLAPTLTLEEQNQARASRRWF